MMNFSLVAEALGQETKAVFMVKGQRTHIGECIPRLHSTFETLSRQK